MSKPVAAGNLNFVLICVFIDMLGIGLIVPVLPVLVGEFTGSRETRRLVWHDERRVRLMHSSAPMLGAISDRIGRRPVLLYSWPAWRSTSSPRRGRRTWPACSSAG
jgi:DHA1 family tetracycline resistance protein-like MFS transporter